VYTYSIFRIGFTETKRCDTFKIGFSWRLEVAHVSRRDLGRDLGREMDGKTGIWVERRESETGFGAVFPSTSFPLLFFRPVVGLRIILSAENEPRREKASSLRHVGLVQKSK
jgi:hypothetical protein